MVLLYHHAHSPYCRKVRIVLEEKKIPHELISIALENKQQKKEEFLKHNAWSKVPVLTDGNLTISESGAINEYLEEQYPETRLLPNGTHDRAKIRALERIQDHHLAAELDVLFNQYFFTKPGARDEKLVAQAFKNIQSYLNWAEQLLQDKVFFGGDLFTLADAAHVHPFLNQLILFNIDVTPFLNINQWVMRMRERESVNKTDPGTYRIPQPARKIAV